MIFRPVFHVVVLGIIAALGALFVFLSVSAPPAAVGRSPSLLIVVAVIIMSAGPSILRAQR